MPIYMWILRCPDASASAWATYTKANVSSDGAANATANASANAEAYLAAINRNS